MDRSLEAFQVAKESGMESDLSGFSVDELEGAYAIQQRDEGSVTSRRVRIAGFALGKALRDRRPPVTREQMARGFQAAADLTYQGRGG